MKNSKFKFSKILLYSRILCSKISKYEVLIVVLNPISEDAFVIGATVIEREDEGPVTVRSALELVGSAFALHPGFAEAEILDMGAGVRPSLPDHVPRIVVENGGKTIRVNGMYRHGFLLSPVMAEAVAAFVARGERHVLMG